MVKITKQRPRRLFYDEKTKRYFYLINNKKKYIKVNKDIGAKAIAYTNIQNILPAPVRRKAIRPRTSIKPITNEPIVSKLIPIAPISANLTERRLYQPKDEDLEKRLTKIEERFKPVLVQPSIPTPKPTIPSTSTPIPTTPSTSTPFTFPSPSSYFAKITKAKAPIPSTLGSKEPSITASKESSTTSLFGSRVAKPKTKEVSSFFDFFKRKQKVVPQAPFKPTGSESKEDTRVGESKEPEKKSMDKKQFEASLKKFEKSLIKKDDGEKKKKDLDIEDYNEYLEFQMKDKTYGKYEPANYDFWKSDIRFLPELQTLPPEERLSLEEEARKARMSYFVPLKEGSKIMVKRKEGEEKTKDEAEIPTGSFKKFIGNGDYENDDDGIFNDELQEIFKDKMNKFLPVIPADRMNELLPLVNKDTKKFGWIQNTEPAGSMGRHWVAYYIDIPNMEVNFYDSLVENNGEPPKSSLKGLKKIIDKIHPEYYLKFKYSQIRDQNPSSKNCGYFALKFIMDRYRNVPFKSATGYDKVYDNYNNGETEIKRFKKYL